MQSKDFWRDLATEFAGLLTSRVDATSLYATESGVGGSDPLARADFERLAKRGGVGLGAAIEHAVVAWLAALRDYLENVDPKHQWRVDFSVTSELPTEVRRIDLHAVHPLAHRPSTSLDQQKLANLRDQIQAQDVPRFLRVTETDNGFALLDTEAEHMKYHAYLAIQEKAVDCNILTCRDQYVVEDDIQLDHICEASQRLCYEQGTRALSADAKANALLEGDPVAAEGKRQQQVPPQAEVEASGRAATLVPPLAVRKARFKKSPGGRHWEVAFGDERSERIQHVKGMELIRRLLSNPGQVVHVSSLLAETIQPGQLAHVDTGQLTVNSSFAGIDATDLQTIRESRGRIGQLQRQKDQADPVLEEDLIRKWDDEIAQLEEYLHGATGLSRRVRRIGSDAERGRKTASKQYGRALQKLSEAGLVGLVAHLKSFVRPGNSFEYKPDPHIDWQA